jgi:hypothetical protein
VVKDGVQAFAFAKPGQAAVRNEFVNKARYGQTERAPLENAVWLEGSGAVVGNLYVLGVRVPGRPVLRCREMLPYRCAGRFDKDFVMSE